MIVQPIVLPPNQGLKRTADAARLGPNTLIRTTMKTNQDDRPKPKVFICYARQDEASALHLHSSLAAAGVEPWLDKKRLVLGDDWELEIKHAVSSADAFVVCLRPGFDEIGFRQKEVRWALEAVQRRPLGRGFIIPYLIQSCELPIWCEAIHAGSELSEPTPLGDLLRAIERHTGQQLPLSRYDEHGLIGSPRWTTAREHGFYGTHGHGICECGGSFEHIGRGRGDWMLLKCDRCGERDATY